MHLTPRVKTCSLKSPCNLALLSPSNPTPISLAKKKGYDREKNDLFARLNQQFISNILHIVGCEQAPSTHCVEGIFLYWIAHQITQRKGPQGILGLCPRLCRAMSETVLLSGNSLEKKKSLFISHKTKILRLEVYLFSLFYEVHLCSEFCSTLASSSANRNQSSTFLNNL